MSIIDKLLVLFDDEKSRTLMDVKNIFPSFTKQVLSSSLGRISAKGFLIKNKSNGRYVITSIGRKKITDELENLKKFEERERSNHCRFVIFNIPEAQRVSRDLMRIFLVNNGYIRIHNTVWINFYSDKTRLEEIIAELKINNQILTFEAEINKQYIDDIYKYIHCDFTLLHKEYSDFIKKAQSFIKLKKKNQFDAQCLVFDFSKIIKKDPTLPKQYLSKTYNGFKAYELYSRIRQYCY